MSESLQNPRNRPLYDPQEIVKDNDFIGFTFGKDHSSKFGIVRTSEGSRYNENLLPSIQDKTIQIPGGDGFYFFGSYYTQRQFNISFAFNTMTETNFRELKSWLAAKEPQDLIFDELPYKIYKAKVTGSATIKHICFMENGERVYKGEGSIQFTCYNPFAHTPSSKKYLNQYSDSEYLNKEQWADASGLLKEQGKYDTLYSRNIPLYNCGDFETDFKLTINFPNDGIIEAGGISLFENTSKQLFTNTIQREKPEDYAIRFNSKNNLIEGVDGEGKITGSLYNKYLKSGDFFKIPTGETDMILSGYAISEDTIKIEYDYIYV